MHKILILFVFFNMFVVFLSTKSSEAGSYRMVYIFENHHHDQHVWLPVPRVWDGKVQKSIDILSISPAPNEVYVDPSSGTQIAYWDNAMNKSVFNIVFTA